MSNDLLTLDLRALTEKLTTITEQLQEKLEVAAKSLSIQVQAHIKEEAAAKLHTRLELYNQNLDWQELEPGVYSVILHKEARWIEDGMEQHDMLESLLSSPKAKTGRNGRYIVIPFKHSKGPTKQGNTEKRLLAAIKTELKKKDIPYMETESNPDGSPKLGLLHKFDLLTPKIQHKVKLGQIGPQGKGMAVSPNPHGQEGPGSRPYLWGVRVYQKMGSGGVERGIFTFRTASDSQKGSGKWVHPGVPPVHLFEDALQWAKSKWDSEIAPEILEGLK